MREISFKQENQLANKQSQHLLLSMAMQQAFHVLQMPILELSQWLRQEIEQNPVLEIDETESSNQESLEEMIQEPSGEPCDKSYEEAIKKKKAYEESLLSYPVSLYEHLMQQARFAFDSSEDLAKAELIIGHLDERGFLTEPLDEISTGSEKILKILQTFDPPGIAAYDLKDSLRLQLSQKNKSNTLAYQVIDHYLEDLIQNRFPSICKSLSISMEQLQQTIETDISPLDIHPGYRFHTEHTSPIIADIHLHYHDQEWTIQINQSLLPHFHLSPAYQKCLDHFKKEELSYIKQQLSSGHWLKKIIHRRRDTLKHIADFLITTQASFLSGDQKTLVPITLQEMAQAIGMHESTIARAVANKYLSCPQGMFSLRSFFTQGVTCQNGQKVSNHTLRQLLAQMIEKEDKRRPLSDDSLAKQFKKLGFPCARRTVTKYRKLLQIAPAARRRRWP